MTTEEKQLLLKDLCARLPYKINLLFEGKYKGNLDTISVLDNNVYINAYDLYASVIDGYSLEDTKPYLRPMSSMTDEEAIKYVTLTHYNTDDNGKPYRELTVEALDWLNANHFDYRGLIPMGLALEAPEDMYIIQSLWNKNL